MFGKYYMVLGRGVSVDETGVERMFLHVRKNLPYEYRQQVLAVREGRVEFTDLNPELQRKVSKLAQDWVDKEAHRRRR